MKKLSVIIVLLLVSLSIFAEELNIGIIPEPESVSWTGGSLKVPETMSYWAENGGEEMQDIEEWMTRMSGNISPFMYEKSKSAKRAFLKMIVTGKGEPESYELTVTDNGIVIKSAGKAGLFYGLQSLTQMSLHYDMDIPKVQIKDRPRFEYRGVLLDPSRYFLTTDFIKKQLDMMAYFKLNRLHWHLTDDCGWRIEIKKYPELTEKTAYFPYKSQEDWWLGGMRFCSKDAPDAVGGYYTQEEVREIVEYARKLNITVVPEVDIPGHSGSLIQVHPELSCPEWRTNVLCPGNENVYKFMEDIFLEIMELFPSELIHVGCDEVSKDMWKKCHLCQAKMKEENIGTVEELQSYMMQRFDTFFTKHNRRLVGWNEMLQGGLADGAVVMSWTGVDGGIQAAKQGKNAIMCPERYCYIDGFQDDPTDIRISSGWYLPLNQVYSYDPAPESLGRNVVDKIMGIQGNLWAAWFYTEEETELYLWPRAMAIAELGWTPNDKKDYGKFRANAVESVERMRANGYNAFDLKNEKGERKGFGQKSDALSNGKTVLGHESNPKSKILTDGYIGGWRLDDIWWFLSYGNQDFTVDLEKIEDIGHIGVSFIQARGYRIPGKVEISVSDDNTNYEVIYSCDNTIPYQEPLSYYENRYVENSWKGKTTARYVKVKVLTDKVWGIDEIIVR